ncbi:BTAD domain-containing putative transcriptional regulator [Streptomyces sp. NPDC053048]|uniref:BTAD domain-containing putative transcriptional regulator n=1 Tax=Streptomyces sp. NPDC053048 TaxID=3365694 RepID=UPI0037D5EF10
MQFGLLGPLEVISEGTPVTLGGTKQRATLGRLLLQANRVVATRELLQALWDGDDAPVTARKILQNAVWALRGALSAGPDGSGTVQLLTQAPGYVLKVDPTRVDLFTFQQQVAAGRAALAAHTPEAAAGLLRGALDLWRGPVLADLVETGIAWPELTAVEKSRLDAMEDFFEAELACGRHHAVLGRLEAMVDGEPLRERSCGQLMLALYRCGRQADALNLYDRVRASLGEGLGLMPGRGLQMLQQSILNHDPSLMAAGSPAPTPEPAAVAAVPAAAGAPATPAAVTPAAVTPVPAAASTRPSTGRRRPDEAGATERMRVSALLVCARPAGRNASSPGAVDSALAGLASVVRDEIERCGGTFVANIGSVTLALFGIHAEQDASERAVRTALAVHERFAADRGATVAAAVTKGHALVRRHPGDDGDLGIDSSPPSVVGTLLDDGRTLLAQVPDGQVWVCGPTRRDTSGVLDFRRVAGPTDAWQVLGVRGAPRVLREYARVEAAGDYEHELDLLTGLLDWSRHRALSHLVTVLGEPGSGKSRFLAEFERRAAGGYATAARFVRAHEPSGGDPGPLAVPAQVLAACCGILPGDSIDTAHEKLSAALRLQTSDPAARQRLGDRLLPLLSAVGAALRPYDTGEVLDAWREFTAAAARVEPLVVAVDDVHLADDALLGCLESLADARPGDGAALLVVVTARPGLLERRPHWSGSKRRAVTITLTPAADEEERTPIAV